MRPKNALELSSTEIILLVVSSAFIALVLTWRSWGDEIVDIALGVASLTTAFFFAVGILLLRTAFAKKVAYRMGYYMKFNLHKWGLATSLFLVVFTNGLLPYVAPNEFAFKDSRRLRLGHLRYGPNFVDFALICLSATIVSVVIMIPLGFLYYFTQNFFLYMLIKVNAAIGFFSLIPIPKSDGFNLMFYKRWLWVFVTALVGFYFFLILTAGLFSLSLATLLAGIVMYLYLKYLE